MLPFRALSRLEPLLARNLRFDLAAAVLGALYTVIPTTFGGVVARRIGAEPFQISALFALVYSGALLSAFSGLWMPRGHLILYAVVVGITARSVLAPAGFIADPILYLLALAICWGAADLVGPIIADTWRRIYPIQLRGQLTSLTRAAATLSMLVGASLFGYVLDTLGTQVLFPIGAAIGVLGWLYFSRIRVPAGQVESQARFTPRDLFLSYRADPRLRRWIHAQVIWGCGSNFILPFTAVLLVDRFHASYTEVGLLATATAVASMLSFPIWGRLADTRNPVKLHALVDVGCALVPLGYLLAPATPWLAIAAVVHGVTNAGYEAASFTAFVRLAPEGQYVRYQIAWYAAIGARGMIMPIVAAALFTASWFGPTPVLLISAAFFLVAAAMIRRVSLPDPA